MNAVFHSADEYRVCFETRDQLHNAIEAFDIFQLLGIPCWQRPMFAGIEEELPIAENE